MSRILSILPYVPYPLTRGTYQRVYHLAEQLGSRHELDLFCLAEDGQGQDQRAAFEPFCRRLRFVPFEHPPWPKMFPDRLLDPLPTTVRHWQDDQVAQSLAEFATGQDYELVMFCDLVLWPYVEACFPEHPRRVMDRSRVDWLFQTEELAILKLSPKEKLLRLDNLWRVARLERQVYRQIALEVVCGWDDRDFLRDKLGDDSKILVIPNGYNQNFFSPEAVEQPEDCSPTAIFCGALDYSPNVSGLNWYFEEIHSRILEQLPGYKLLVVGKNPGSNGERWAQFPGVELIGEVPDVRPYYRRAWAQVVPLRIGGGTRLKIVESLGIGTPVVSTTLGAQGLELRHERHLLLADHPGDFSRAVTQLLRDEDLRSTLRRQGLEQVLENYTWQRVAKNLLQALDKLL